LNKFVNVSCLTCWFLAIAEGAKII
jgi:hypothetical protein